MNGKIICSVTAENHFTNEKPIEEILAKLLLDGLRTDDGE